MGRIIEHDLHKISGPRGCNDPPLEPVHDKLRQKAGMVKMGMCKEQEIYLLRIEGKGNPVYLVCILPLVHPAIHEDLLVPQRQMIAGARHDPCGPKKPYLHIYTSAFYNFTANDY